MKQWHTHQLEATWAKIWKFVQWLLHNPTGPGMNFEGQKKLASVHFWKMLVVSFSSLPGWRCWDLDLLILVLEGELDSDSIWDSPFCTLTLGHPFSYPNFNFRYSPNVLENWNLVKSGTRQPSPSRLKLKLTSPDLKSPLSDPFHLYTLQKPKMTIERKPNHEWRCVYISPT